METPDPNGNGEGRVTFTVKEMLQDMDARFNTRLDTLDSKLDTALVQMESKVDRQRVHDLTTVVATVNLAKVDRVTEFTPVTERVAALENHRSKFYGAIAVVGFLASVNALHVWF